ncbi:hypothetical protein CcCBS67573_g08892 [Chytriomyces confervae]|uniref:Uncharacterized protein n=1 Tax=Chytriomyces confervae TaxID=246404 RepID=A0A507EDA2_9FUNG|nr:hypothetical protein HDU80_009219 [Chytriomyces hyalinus]TPX61774.1 hypothetical protein CcCBS67573_g08892 [Chytriomyces confervae]
MSVDILRSLGLHRLLAPLPKDAARTKPSSASLYADITGIAVPKRDLDLSAIEAFLSDLDHEIISHELSPNLQYNPLSNSTAAELDALKAGLSASMKADSDPIFRMHGLILFARISLASGRPAETISLLQEEVLKADVQGKRRIDILADSAGVYNQILYLIAPCVLGQAFLAIQDWSQASTCLDLAASFMSKKPFAPPSITAITHAEVRKIAHASMEISADEWTAWSEEVMYLIVGLSRQKNEHAHLIETAKKYNFAFAQLPIPFCPSKRTTVLRSYLSALATEPSAEPNSQIPQTDEPIASEKLHPFKSKSPFSGLSASQIIFPPQISESVATEFQTLLPLYESLAVQACPFPQFAGGNDAAKQKLMDVRHERVVEMFEWSAIIEFCTGENGVWESVERGYRVIEIMYRATKHTFQNLKMLRYLAHAFSSLLGHLCDSASDAEVSEALLAFKAYNELYTKRRNEAVQDAKKHDVEFSGIVAEESAADAVGVLIGGARVCLAWFRGDDNLLDTARIYVDHALEILNADKSSKISKKDMQKLLARVHNVRGVVYGELGLEVTSSHARKDFQTNALHALRESAQCHEAGDSKSDWNLLYQTALQLGEMGEIPAAIQAIQESLQISSTSVSSWHLLSLLLSSLRRYEQASDVCEAGWKEALEVAPSVVAISDESSDDSEAIIVWDSIPVRVKEDLFNLKLTQLSIMRKMEGPKAALEALQPLFSLFSQMFTPLIRSMDTTNQQPQIPSLAVTPVAYSYASSDASFTRESPKFERAEKTPSTTPTIGAGAQHSRMSTEATGKNVAIAVSPPYFGYSFRMYDLQICLWMMAASLYTDLDCFVDAQLALAEAEQLAKTLVALDQKVRGRESLLFKGSGSVGGSTGFLSEAHIPMPAKQAKRGGGVVRAPPTTATNKRQEESSSPKSWNLADSTLRRVLADVCFGNAMLKAARFRNAATPRKVTLISKYQSTDLDDDTVLQEGRTRRPSVHSTFTIKHGTTSSTRSLGSIKAKSASIKGSSHSLAANLNPSTGRLRTGSPASTHSHAGSTMPSAVQQEPPVSLDMIINELHACLALDGHHIPACVELARCYQMKKSDAAAEAEYWFEQACKRSKMRGSGSGSRGLSSYFGGLTGPFGFECWSGLGATLKDSAVLGEDVNASRLKEAKECFLFAVQMDRVVTVRGLQCLNRLSE